MASHGGTLLDMGKDKPKKPGRPQTGRKPTYILYARIKPSIGAALDAYIAATRPTPTQTSAVELALEEFLAKQGFWPPSDAPADD
jgi:hypothetical protein